MQALWKLIGIAAYACSPFAIASAGTVADCESVAQVSRPMIPIKKDRLTFVNSIGCAPGKQKAVLTYGLVTTAEESVLRKLDFSEIKQAALGEFCSSTEMAALLTAFDVRHTYASASGTKLGSFLMESRECDASGAQGNALELYAKSLEPKQQKYSGEPWRACAVEIEEGMPADCFALSGGACKANERATELLTSKRTRSGVSYQLLTVDGKVRKRNICELSNAGTIIRIRELQ